MKQKNSIFWFTLVEIIISITILSIIMISVMVIFTSSSALSLKVDLNRSVQENVKNAVEDMAENVRKERLNICSPLVPDNCYNFTGIAGKYVYADTLYVGTHKYYLWKQAITGDRIKVTNPDECLVTSTFCTLIKDGQYPLTNKNIVFRKMNFAISDEKVPKVTMFLSLAPSPKRGVAAWTIDKDIFYFETTITQSLINEK